MSDKKLAFDISGERSEWKMVVLGEDDQRRGHYTDQSAPRDKPDFIETFGISGEKLNTVTLRSRVMVNALPIKKGRSARLRKKAGVTESPVTIGLGSPIYRKIVEAAENAVAQRQAERARWRARYGVPTKRNRKGS